jgi:tRNA1(Val) A37 N6-methylase TrmN6
MSSALATTQDRFLNGAVTLKQSAFGYRAGVDSVLLAAALHAPAEARLAELGCGPGAALICAAWRLKTARFIGVEADGEAAELAQENAEANGLADRVEIVHGDVAGPAETESVDQVFFNPPFFDDPSALRAPKAEKTRAWLSGEAPLETWIEGAARRLTGKGRLTLIHRADKLADILAALKPRFGSVAIKPIHPRLEKPAKRVVVTARMNGRAPLVMLPPLALHDDQGGKYSAEADAILRGEADLPMEG